jgi:ElaB/YqjD/DUF883 family membrane-anchored ribosome-binding protein
MTQHTDEQVSGGGKPKEQYAELAAALEKLGKAVEERPLLGVGLAMAAGFLLGTLWRK